MRALQRLLIGLAGSLGGVEARADGRGDPPAAPAAGGGSGLSLLEPWPGDDIDVPVFFSDVEDAEELTTIPATAPAAKRAPFSKGSWAVQLTGSYYWSITGSEVEMPYGSVNVGYYYADTWAVDMHASGYLLRENGQSEGFAASIGLNLRKHFFIRDPWSVYIDGGIGMIRADGQFPDEGTNTNFTLQGGLGATYRLSETLHLVGGVRWFHISNARRHGEDGNMSTDGPAVYAGVMWAW